MNMKKILILLLIVFGNILARGKANSKFYYAFPPDTSIYANLQVTTTLTDMGNLGKYYDATITASFFDGLTHTIVPVSSVKYNGKVLFRDTTFGGNYFDTSGTQPVAGKIWEVSGLGSIPSFSFQPINPSPKYSDFNLLPNIINTSSDLSVPLSGISDATHVMVTLNDGNSNDLIESVNLASQSQSRLSGNASYSANTLQVQSVDMSSLTPSNKGNLLVIVSNTDIQIISGKRIAFTNTFLYLKNNLTYQ
jgi:hypothetical protein